MKNLLLIFTAVTLSGFFNPAFAEIKIGFVQVDKILKEAPQTQASNKRLEKEFKSKTESLKKMIQGIQKELQEHIQKYYGEKVDQRAAETAYGTLLRNKIADHSMKTFKIKETKLNLDEMMKKGSHNHEPGSHSH